MRINKEVEKLFCKLHNYVTLLNACQYKKYNNSNIINYLYLFLLTRF